MPFRPSCCHGEERVSERYDQGMATRREVLGDAHVDRAEAARTSFDAPFQDLITEAAWGHVWSREGLARRDRSLLTLALLAALGNDAELAMHVRATARTGARPEEVMEAMLHVAIYAGVPRANHAIRIVKETYAEMGVET
ncbi:4-carboxymuconolactone decarboxylase [Rhodosalinus sp. 5P4]|uniref:4-carboxymuconolactone decarboxylase n=1 Tax=Rhodosalinus sp. 5P4 TaxID=3239196 RepID=UPI0035259EBF